MAQSLNIYTIIVSFLAGLLLASIPFAFYWYFALLIQLTKIFLVICVIDFIQKKSRRKSAGLILSFMFLAAIVSTLAMYSLSYFNIQ